MDIKYAPHEIEQKWYQKWERANYFAPRGNHEAYSIVLPPPNVTGSLHMGHGFQHTLMDALIRYQRMNQRTVLWQAGTDHAGISTQLVVERQLYHQGQSRQDFSREAFVAKIWDWKAISGDEIARQMRRMGSSLDWSRERFTLDDALSRAVVKVFVQFYQEGLIYRGKRLVNWDPKLRTAISDLEVVAEEEAGQLWYIEYPLVSGEGKLVVATTRPETLFGDVAVVVHPDDPRYAHWVGQQVLLPLSGRTIPIIADPQVDASFGSGCVKVTPAHDFNDYEIAKRHGLPSINLLNPDASLNDEVPAAYRGLDRFKARTQVLAELTQLGLLQKSEPHRLKVPRGEKSGVVIEPLLTDQWFVQIKPLAEPAILAVARGEVRFFPENWSKTYFQWLEQAEDWCISRQLWWGHRIPAWYDTDENVYVGYSEEDVRFRYDLPSDCLLRQDEDVLDTWFSSALWPFSALGWPEKTDELKRFYPTDVLVTGFDIIFFWVARMIMMALKLTGKVPFRDVYVTGLIRDSEGQKMSKSKGNVLDPIDIIDGISLEHLLEKRTANLMLETDKSKIIKRTQKEFPEGIAAYGTDALRFTYCALATTGRDIRFDMGRVAGYRNFCNKLWNAARYVLMNTVAESQDWGDGAFQYSPADRWILSRLQRVTEKAHTYFASYRFDLLAQCLYEFVWHEYCDWYLELSKPLLNHSHALESHKRGTRKTLLQVLEQITRLLHPIMPFITEEIWRKVAPLAGPTSTNSRTIMRQRYPIVQPELYGPEIEEEIAWLQSVVLAIRNMRSSLNVSPARRLSIWVYHGTDIDLRYLKKYRESISTLAHLEGIQVGKPDSGTLVSTALVGTLEIYIPMAGLIDAGAEAHRLEKEILKLNQSVLKSEEKVANPDFVARAPAAVLAQEKERLAAANTHLEHLKQKLSQLRALV